MADFKITHIALWVRDLEKVKDFYVKYFNFVSNDGYHNPKKGFSSYFLSLGDRCRLELMHRDDIESSQILGLGYAHMAISVGSESAVDILTRKLAEDGYKITSPRHTGDGYYESTVLDPDGNVVEITV